MALQAGESAGGSDNLSVTFPDGADTPLKTAWV